VRPINVLFAAFALLQALRYGRKAALFVFPVARIWGEAEAGPRSARRLRLGADLEELGFTSLGIRHERAGLGARQEEADVYVSVERGAYADVVQERGPEGPGVLFFTPFADGAAVLTAAFQRTTFASQTAQVGSMPEARLPAVLGAHELAVRRFALTHRAPQVEADLEARLAAARRWTSGEGRREVRRAHAMGFAIFALALLIFVSSLKILALGAK
jgi:hypothetical protein